MRRINIGFQGGGTLAARLDDDALSALRNALSGDGWYQLDTADGRVDLRLATVVYVSDNAKEPRVGFSGP
jgi:hypothetical protein